MFIGACLEEPPVIFVTEFMPGGDLERFYAIKRRGTLNRHYRPPLPQITRWAGAVARALTFLHNCTRPIIHRDLKPMNLLLTRSLDLKVADFGISKLMHKRPTSARYKMTGGIGTCMYMAPEVVRHERYTEKVDIFSFALTLYFMSSGKDPFHEMGEDPEVILTEYIRGNEPRPNLDECHLVLKEIIKDAWQVTPASRPSAKEMVMRLSEVKDERNSLCICKSGSLLPAEQRSCECALM